MARLFAFQKTVVLTYDALLSPDEVRDIFPDLRWDPDVSQAGDLEDKVQTEGLPDGVLRSMVKVSEDVTLKVWEE